MTKDEALDMLNRWMTQSVRFPERDLIIKVPNLHLTDIPTKEELDNWLVREKYSIDEYSFRHLLCVAYDLTEKNTN